MCSRGTRVGDTRPGERAAYPKKEYIQGYGGRARRARGAPALKIKIPYTPGVRKLFYPVSRRRTAPTLQRRNVFVDTLSARKRAKHARPEISWEISRPALLAASELRHVRKTRSLNSRESVETRTENACMCHQCGMKVP